ncbi:MAG: hypothetical protein QGI09_09470, partial [Dehalococcoidia bacterium]|nr:hypothetical protein [Dehalococcoidia bacterium]
GPFVMVPVLGILQQGRDEIVASMPEGEGKKTVVRICSECHSLENVVSEQKFEEMWGRVIDEMMSRGAQIFGDEKGMVAAYLGKYYGPDRSVLDVLTKARHECLF